MAEAVESKSIFYNTSDAVYRPDDVFENWSKLFLEMTRSVCCAVGVLRDHELMTYISGTVPTGEKERIREELLLAIGTNQPDRSIGELTPNIGALSIFSAPLFDGGEVLGAFSVGYSHADIDREVIEETLRIPVQLLAKYIGAKNRELKSAKLLDETSGLLSFVSHEIRTPLTAIMGLTSWLKEPGRSYSQELVQSLDGSVQQLYAVVSDVLDQQKMQAGKFVLRKAPFNLHALLKDVQQMHLPLAHAKGLDIKIEPGGGLPDSVMGDRSRLTQVLSNLIINAIKFTRAGEITLGPSCVSSNSAGSKIRFSVADTGIGLTPEQQTRLFMPFEQIADTGFDAADGTGLGLTIVRSLVRLMGGDIHFASRAVGSEFWFEIYFHTGLISMENANDTPATHVLPRFKSQRVLLVEDHAINQWVIQHALEGWGLTVTTVARGSQAINALTNENFDLVLMDIQLPEMNGLETTRQIRQMPMGRMVPILALTGSDSEQTKAGALQVGMNDFVVKPIQAADLHAKLARHLVPGSA